MSDDADDFDDAFAAQLLGTYILAGLTNYNHAGEIESREQFHGRVIRASASEGVILLDSNGQERWLPAHRDSYAPADPGEYRLRSTGEIVLNPDYLTTWHVYPPERH